MEPFNIKVGYGDREVTLTILPVNEHYFKVVYFTGVLGAIRYQKDTDEWVIVPQEELPVGDLPNFVNDLSSDRLDIVLTEETVEEIGNEIDLYVSLMKDSEN